MEENVRTNIVIDDELMAEALAGSNLKTKKETVEAALELLVEMKKQSSIRDLREKLQWDGDHDTMRTDT